MMLYINQYQRNVLEEEPVPDEKRQDNNGSKLHINKEEYRVRFSRVSLRVCIRAQCACRDVHGVYPPFK